MDKPELLICACHSIEHQITIAYDEDDNQAYCSIHLNKIGFWKRIGHAIKYIFGYKCMFGDFDEMILDHTHADALIAIGNKLAKNGHSL